MSLDGTQTLSPSPLASPRLDIFPYLLLFLPWNATSGPQGRRADPHTNNLLKRISRTELHTASDTVLQMSACSPSCRRILPRKKVGILAPISCELYGVAVSFISSFPPRW